MSRMPKGHWRRSSFEFIALRSGIVRKYYCKSFGVSITYECEAFMSMRPLNLVLAFLIDLTSTMTQSAC